MVISDISKKSDLDTNNLLEENIRLKVDLELFTYIFSHDLKKPLRVLLNNSAQLVNSSKEIDNELICEISQASTDMQHVIDIMLDYIRIEVFKVESSSVDVNDIVKSIYDKHKEDAIITFDTMPNILGNKNHINTVFSNIISNAIKYKNNTRQVKINIYHSEFDNMVEFKIRDNGIGIEEEYFEIIFLLFQRLHTKDEYPGYGAGLAIAKKIIESQGGRIWVESDYGENTNICFTLKKA